MTATSSSNTPLQPPVDDKPVGDKFADTTPSSTPLTEALRKVGEEAARKAGKKDVKPASKVTSEGSDAEVSKVDKALEQSAAVPPPTGVAMEDPEAEAPASGNNVASPLEDHSENKQNTVIARHRGSDVSLASPEEIEEIERATAIPEEDEEEAELAETQKEEDVAAIIEEPNVQDDHKTAEKIQDQPAAKGELAGTSVGD